MTTLFWVELVCAECATTSMGRFCSNIPVRYMKTKEAGWRFYDVHAFCSLHCESRFKDKEGK